MHVKNIYIWLASYDRKDRYKINKNIFYQRDEEGNIK